MTEPAPNHEFTTEENTTIAGLAIAMSYVAVFQVLLAMLFGAAAILSMLGGNLVNAIWFLFLTVANVLLAAALLAAASKFRKIVFTAGSDVPLLMVALDHLLRYFWVRRLLLLVTLMVIALGLAAHLMITSGAAT